MFHYQVEHNHNLLVLQLNYYIQVKELIQKLNYNLELKNLKAVPNFLINYWYDFVVAVGTRFARPLQY